MPKEDIGRKVTAGGIIAISNWHVLSEEGEPEDDGDIETPGAPAIQRRSCKASCL